MPTLARGVRGRLLTLPEQGVPGCSREWAKSESVCLSEGREAQETNDVNPLPLELADYCPDPSLGLCSALTVDCGAEPCAPVHRKVARTLSSTRRFRAAASTQQPCHPSSYSLTSDCGPDCARVLEQHHDAELRATFINLQLGGHGTWAGREFTCKLTLSVCVENCTKETWESSNRDHRCTWKISAA